jgi:flagellar biosynthesis protein
MHVDLDARIPPSLYLAVAEMLTWIHGLETAENNTEPLKPSEFGES